MLVVPKLTVTTYRTSAIESRRRTHAWQQRFARLRHVHFVLRYNRCSVVACSRRQYCNACCCDAVATRCRVFWDTLQQNTYRACGFWHVVAVHTLYCDGLNVCLDESTGTTHRLVPSHFGQYTGTRRHRQGDLLAFYVCLAKFCICHFDCSVCLFTGGILHCRQSVHSYVFKFTIMENNNIPWDSIHSYFIIMYSC